MDHVAQVVKNLEHMKDLEVASEMDISVLGSGDDLHKRDYGDDPEALR